MRKVDRVSCPFTYGVLDDKHRQWCLDTAGKHCDSEAKVRCPWRKVEEKKEPVKKTNTQLELW